MKLSLKLSVKQALKPFYLLLVFAGLMLLSQTPTRADDMPADTPTAYIIQVKGEINTGTYDLIHRGLLAAAQQKADIVVLQIQTPGGLYTSMQDIVQDIMDSPVPVATYVSPSGARAASAGTYILYGSHIAAMAPGTNIGAATPIRMIDQTSPFRPPDSSMPDKGPIKPHSTLEQKMINDAAAYIRGLAEYRNRNAQWAEKAVREAESISAPEALSKKAIDVIADDVPDLLNKIDGRTVKMAHGKTIRLHTKGAVIDATKKADLRTNLLDIIGNPNIAFLLLIIGAYGIIYEVFHPGLILPGVVGAVALILALFAMHLLPTNYTGLALIGLGIAMMIGEAFVPSFGALGIGGAIAFAVGASMLFSSGDPTMGIDPWLIAGTTLVSVGFLSVLVAVAIRAQRRHPTTGMEELMSAVGEVVSWSQGEGEVFITGEVWKAAAASPDFILNKGDLVKVESIDGLCLIIRPEQ
ncbi:MAG: nodulation protein NfeD [Alphaproteobacteria bacterium]|nr:nodulation protein NfeD [Alphaproteobacteria bacterium]